MEDNRSKKQSKEASSELNPEQNDLIGRWERIKQFFAKLLDLRYDTDKEGTIEDIKQDISIKGPYAWILIFSIIICSIGLNISSPAVVIGAMLIAPLMGPILGIGLSIGINDIDTLQKSLINLGVMIVLSITTSMLFFSVPIFQNETPELLSRTAPDVRDVFIAIAGGLALIIALSRRKKQSNKIAGVAIATALMPPLCTAGYGLAIWNLSYFGGAMFLFISNTVFLALGTFVIVKFLRFPMVRYINSEKRKKIAQAASFVALIIFGASLVLFFNLFKETKYRQSAYQLIHEIKESGISIIDEKEENINYNNKTIKVYVYGQKLSEKEIKTWEDKLPDYGLGHSDIIFEQGADDADIKKEIQNLTNLYRQNREIISSQNKLINFLESKLNPTLQFQQISEEAKIIYPGLKTLSYSLDVTTDFEKIDTALVFTTVWQDTVAENSFQKSRLKKWLKKRYLNDSIRVN